MRYERVKHNIRRFFDFIQDKLLTKGQKLNMSKTEIVTNLPNFGDIRIDEDNIIRPQKVFRL